MPSVLRLGTAAFALAVAVSAARPASAQSVGLDQYRMAETPGDGFALSRPNDQGHLSFGARLDVDYALDPLVYQLRGSASDSETAPIVEHHLVGNLGVSFGLFDRLVVYAGVPVNLVMEGDRIDGQPRADGTSLGDVWFGLRGRLFGEADDAFALSLQATATAPTARAARFQSRFAGEASWTLHPELLMEVRFADVVRITGNAGARIRERQDFGALEVRSELTWGLGVAAALVPDVLDLTVESWGATSLFDFGEGQLTPIEAVAGLQVHPVEGWTVGAAAGTGVQRGWGAGDFRAILSAGYASPGEQPPGDRDADGVTDDVDGCPDEPEDSDGFRDDDGCPDPDNDGDGRPDAADDCPDRPEDLDGLGDEDGCPEEDFDEDGAPDETDRCPTEPGIALAPRPECTGCPTCESPRAPEPPPEAPSPAPAAPAIDARVSFEVGSYALRPSQLEALEAVRAYLEAHPGTSIIVEGHADYRGTEPRNQILSRHRARRVMRWLERHGVDPSRLTGVGCGEAYPAEPNETRQGRRANRRVEFRPMGQGPVLRPGCTETRLPEEW
jgi:outer membrane protein OmpA-like peptidoglycan-associated protein